MGTNYYLHNKPDIDLTKLLGNHSKLLELLPDYDDDVWLRVETEDNFCLLDDIKCDISFCKKAVRYELARLSEIEKTTDKVTADWSERCQKLEAQRDRLLTLATKWCDPSHHDWAEIKRVADSA